MSIKGSGVAMLQDMQLGVLIWGADLPDMQLISKFNKEARFLLCVIDIFSKNASIVSLKDKKKYNYC